jgi:hypothetical protein
VGLTAILQFSESWYTIQKGWEGTSGCSGGVTRGNRDFHVRKFPLAAASDSLTNVLYDHRKDILVVVDQHLQEKKGETVKTAELLKAAGCVQSSSC